MILLKQEWIWSAHMWVIRIVTYTSEHISVVKISFIDFLCHLLFTFPLSLCLLIKQYLSPCSASLGLFPSYIFHLGFVSSVSFVSVVVY